MYSSRDNMVEVTQKLDRIMEVITAQRSSIEKGSAFYYLSFEV